MKCKSCGASDTHLDIRPFKMILKKCIEYEEPLCNWCRVMVIRVIRGERS